MREDDIKPKPLNLDEINVEKRFASSDRNFVESLLFQWWGLLEQPNRQRALHFFNDIVDSDATLQMQDDKLYGREAIKEYLINSVQSHHAHQLNNIDVTPLGNRRYQLDATFGYQVQHKDGSLTGGASTSVMEAARQADGTFRLVELEFNRDTPVAATESHESYTYNRAHGTIVQFLGEADLLDSDFERVVDILTNNATIHGMIAPNDNTFSERRDGVLRERAEIFQWLSGRKNNMRWVAHKLKSIEFKHKNGNHYDVAAIIDIETQPVDGDGNAVTLPIEISLEDNDKRFMYITRVKR